LEFFRTPVTQRAYEEVVGVNPAQMSGADLPVVDVSWFDAVRFCNALSRRDGFAPAYELPDPVGGSPTVVRWRGPGNEGWRLPTEAEWEYACRAGSEDVRYGEPDDIAWHKDNAQGRMHEVGLKRPNAWGLHDTLGLVWEWCWDWSGGAYWNRAEQAEPSGRLVWNASREAVFALGRHKGRLLRDVAAEAPEYLKTMVEEPEAFGAPVRAMAGDALAGVFPVWTAASDGPAGPATGAYRVCRGGGYLYGVWFARASQRFSGAPGEGYGCVGLRPCRTVGR
jgi:formylglycine-generating enzyme required for sulfatase activity